MLKVFLKKKSQYVVVGIRVVHTLTCLLRLSLSVRTVTPLRCNGQARRPLEPTGLSSYMENSRQEKVQKFEEFVDKRLKPDLLHAISQRDKVFEQQKIFADLRRNIENLEKNSVTSLRTLVNLGSEVYLQAEVENTQHIFVDVGFGFHVEFTWSEALNYIEKREEKIAR
ncbi:protein UXT homolog isoform X2 [Cajanus cajan]|nr:protein UXT homolog isoform X2 [Cajanus cajan]